MLLLTDTAHTACVPWGPFTVQWSLDDATVLQELLADWPRRPVGGAADVRISARARTIASSRRYFYSLPHVRTEVSNETMTFSFGNALRATWRVNMAEMDCVYETGWTHPKARLLTAALPWLLATWMAQHDRFLLHASAVVTDGRADLFVGPSGVGKTTIASSVDPGRVVHDEAVFVERVAGSTYVSSGEWHRHAAATPGMRWPLHRICLLTREGAIGLQPIGRAEALSSLLACTFYNVPGTPQWYRRRLEVVGQWVEQYPCYHLRYRLHQDDVWQWLMPGRCAQTPDSMVGVTTGGA